MDQKFFGINATLKALEQAITTEENGEPQGSFQMILTAANEEFQKKPWVYLGAVAVGVFGIGYTLGNNLKEQRSGERQ